MKQHTKKIKIIACPFCGHKIKNLRDVYFSKSGFASHTCEHCGAYSHLKKSDLEAAKVKTKLSEVFDRLSAIRNNI